MEKKNVVKLGAAIGVAALLVGAGVSGGLVENTWSTTVEGLDGQISELTNLNVDQVNVIDNLNLEIARLNAIEPEVINNTIEVEVEVDNENLDLVSDFIIDADGNLAFLIDGIDTDNVEEVVDSIVFINDAIKLGSDEIKSEFADEIDKINIVINSTTGENVTFDEDDIERLKIKDDLDEVIFSDFDFEDKDLTIAYEIEFEQDDAEYKADVIIEFKDGKIEDFDIENIELIN